MERESVFKAIGSATIGWERIIKFPVARRAEGVSLNMLYFPL
jgi:hypothetical protein